MAEYTEHPDFSNEYLLDEEVIRAAIAADLCRLLAGYGDTIKNDNEAKRTHAEFQQFEHETDNLRIRLRQIPVIVTVDAAEQMIVTNEPQVESLNLSTFLLEFAPITPASDEWQPYILCAIDDENDHVDILHPQTGKEFGVEDLLRIQSNVTTLRRSADESQATLSYVEPAYFSEDTNSDPEFDQYDLGAASSPAGFSDYDPLRGLQISSQTVFEVKDLFGSN